MVRQQVVFIGASVLIAVALSLVANHLGFLVCALWFISLLFFTGLNVVLLVIYSLTRQSEDFTGILLGCLVAKLLLSLVTLLLFRVFANDPLLPFAIHFIVHFVVFTVFEIRYVLWLIRTRVS